MKVENIIVTIEGIDAPANAGFVISAKHEFDNLDLRSSASERRSRRFIVEIKPSYSEAECYKKIEEVLKKLLFRKEEMLDS